MKDRPVLTWEWRATKFPPKPAGVPVTKKSHCDFAARVCVVFAGNTPWESHYIYYVWDPRYKVEDRGSSSGLISRTKVLVVENSPGGRGSAWVPERRDVIADYEMLFGRKPERPFRAIGIISDSDQTESSSAAEFRRLRICRPAPASGRGKSPTQ
jgi:hypothetical protein